MHSILSSTLFVFSLLSLASASSLEHRAPLPLVKGPTLARVQRSSIALRAVNGSVERSVRPAHHHGQTLHHAHKPVARKHRASKRQGGLDVGAILAQATSMLSGMQECQQNFHNSVLFLRNNGPSAGRKHAFQQKVHSQLSQYRRESSDFPVLSKALQTMQASLEPAAKDYGMANLDQCNALETVLTSVNRSIQDMLADVDLAVYSLPILGNALGALVYDIKCLVDTILDVGTNTVDGTLNSDPALSSLSKQLGATACRLTPTLDGC